MLWWLTMATSQHPIDEWPNYIAPQHILKYQRGTLQLHRKIMYIKVKKKSKSWVCSIIWKDVSSVVFFNSAIDVDDFIVCGRLFHTCGSAKAKERLPNSDRGFSTTKLPEDDERSHCLAATTVTGIHSSARYNGARLCRACTQRDTVWNRCVVALGASRGFVGRLICGHIFGDGKWLVAAFMTCWRQSKLKSGSSAKMQLQ